MNCAGCRFFLHDTWRDEPRTEVGSGGVCRRFPPQLAIDARGKIGVIKYVEFPKVHQDEWCGEFQAVDQ